MTRFYSNSKKQIILNRRDKIENWLELKAKGVDDKTLESVLKISRATFYRWNRAYTHYNLKGLRPKSTRPERVRQPEVLTKDMLAIIRTLREEHPFFGKVKIHALCKQQGINISLSSVGRALKYFMDKDIITRVSILKGSKIRKNIRKFTNSYSKRLPNYHKAPIQIDHTIINLREVEQRVFVGYDRVSKNTCCKAYKQATSDNAADFLEFLISQWPYKPTELQVDGGSEFRANFEIACEKNNIKLFVLPPRSPKLNGGVERYNQTLQDEFFLPKYNELPTDVELLNKELYKWQKYYNEERPHRSLLDKQGLPISPVQFLKQNSLKCIEP